MLIRCNGAVQECKHIPKRMFYTLPEQLLNILGVTISDEV